MAGADGLVLFNRWLQPDLNLTSHRVVTQVFVQHAARVGSDAAVDRRLCEAGLRFRWRPRAVFTAASTCSKAIAVGADAVQVASVLYRQGVDALGRIINEAGNWLADHDYPSIKQIKGTLSLTNCADPAAFARANYTRTISSFVTDAV